MLDKNIINYVLENARKKLNNIEKELPKKESQEDREIYLNSLSGDKAMAYKYKTVLDGLGNTNEEQINALCKEWIVNLSKQASQRRFSTHVAKYIDPSVNGVSNIVFSAKRENNGYICSNNVDYYLDSYGNAAAIPVTDFLSLEIKGKKLYQHIEENTEISKDLFSFLGEKKEEVESCFKKALQGDSLAVTDGNLRQVFFPIADDDYYIITPVISMPVLNSFNSIVDKNRKYNNNPLNSETKTPMKVYEFKRKNNYLEGGYLQINGLVDIPYGGANPQNISSFSTKVRNKYLITSLPPQLVKRKTRIPVFSFFSESLYAKNQRYSSIFLKLDKIFKLNKNNKDIRDARDYCLFLLLSEVGSDIASVRDEIKKLNVPYRGNLKDFEYVMLYEDEKRYEDYEWLVKTAEEFSRWFFGSYKYVVENPFNFADDEFHFVKNFAFDNKECFIV